MRGTGGDKLPHQEMANVHPYMRKMCGGRFQLFKNFDTLCPEPIFRPFLSAFMFAATFFCSFFLSDFVGFVSFYFCHLIGTFVCSLFVRFRAVFCPLFVRLCRLLSAFILIASSLIRMARPTWLSRSDWPGRVGRLNLGGAGPKPESKPCNGHRCDFDLTIFV